jgi:hypothetical protein
MDLCGVACPGTSARGVKRVDGAADTLKTPLTFLPKFLAPPRSLLNQPGSSGAASAAASRRLFTRSAASSTWPRSEFSRSTQSSMAVAPGSVPDGRSGSAAASSPRSTAAL